MVFKHQTTSHNNSMVPFIKKLEHWFGDDNLIIVYKLLADVLFLSLLFFALSLVAEGILPGIVTSHVGFSKIVIFIFFLLVIYYFLGREVGKSIKTKNIFAKRNKKTVITLLIISALLIFNIQLKLNLFLNIFVSLVIIATGYFVYRMIFED